METYSVQNIGGRDCIIIQSGPDIHQIDMQSLSSWGVLLGLTDEAEILKAIVQDARDPSVVIDWSELYDALNENLTATSRSGVPAEYVEDLLDPAASAPVPNSEAVRRLKAVRDAAKADLFLNISEPLDQDELTALTSSINSDSVKANRVEFINYLAPVVEVLPELPQLPADWDAIPSV